ncbi:MAG: DUF177 domain-containing protein [Bacteroidota bacterium]
MKINISGLSEGTHRYDLTRSTTEFGLNYQAIGDVTANITLEKSIHQILATVTASVKGVFICDRCADEFTEDVKTKFTFVYSWERTEETEEDDDFHILGKDENLIDFSQSVKEYLMLAVPAKLLCKNNCEIPVHVAAEKNMVDPRWEKLQMLLRSEKN